MFNVEEDAVPEVDGEEEVEEDAAPAEDDDREKESVQVVFLVSPISSPMKFSHSFIPPSLPPTPSSLRQSAGGGGHYCC